MRPRKPLAVQPEEISSTLANRNILAKLKGGNGCMAHIFSNLKKNVFEPFFIYALNVW